MTFVALRVFEKAFTFMGPREYTVIVNEAVRHVGAFEFGEFEDGFNVKVRFL